MTMLEKKSVVLGDPTFAGLFVVVALLLVLVIVKLIFGKRSAKSARQSQEIPTRSARRKKTKKQKNAQDSKNSESPRSRKDAKNSRISSLEETKKPSIEEKRDKRKDGGKSKSKSKKKKAADLQKHEIVQDSFIKDNEFDDDGWKTVSTKEQREQMKREKRKLEVATTLANESTSDKVVSVPLVHQAHYKPLPNPAIAKGIAPRFARAAGAEWQEKPAVVSQPLQSKRPMPPATVPVTTIKPQAKPSTVTQQTWSQGNSTWQENLGWPVTVASTLPSNLATYNPSDAAQLASMVPSSEKNSSESWPQSVVSWQSSGSRNSNSSWEVNGDDWVHVSGTNNKIESWQVSNVTIPKDDVWTFEPEGYSLPQQQIDNCDPWGMEVSQSDTGDWSAPKSTWDNANAEWTVPSPVKIQSTYNEESSDDEASSSKTVPAPSQPETHSVVGISQESLNQKKSRRRRKKKQIPSSEQQLPTAEVKLPEPTVTAVPEVEEKVELKSVEASEDWSVPKASKKRRAKPRKVD